MVLFDLICLTFRLSVGRSARGISLSHPEVVGLRFLPVERSETASALIVDAGSVVELVILFGFTLFGNRYFIHLLNYRQQLEPRDHANALSLMIYDWESVELILFEQGCDHFDALLELESHGRHRHYLFSRDELVAHGDCVVEEWEIFGVDGADVERLVEDTSNREGDEEGEDDRQEKVDILGGF